MDPIITYKILHSTVSIRVIFTMNTNPTRTNGLKIYKYHSNKTVRRYSFSQRITNQPRKLATCSEIEFEGDFSS